MLERLVNEDRAGAEELFHEIVVEKSRDIYEQLLSEEADEEVDETTDEEVDEATDEEVDESDEDLDEATDEEVDESDEDLDEFMEPALEADPTDDMMGDLAAMGDDEPGDEEGDSEGGAEAALDDLEAALDALKDEFAAMMGDGGDDGAEEPEMDMDADDDEEGEEEAMAFEADDEVEEASDDVEKTPTEQMREYVEKIGGDQYQAYGKMGDNGANTKSPVAGKNDMGGTASNMTQGKDNEAGAHDGLGDMNSKEENAGNVNVPGGKAAKAGKSEPGHGAEKKATGDNGQNKKSTIGS